MDGQRLDPQRISIPRWTITRDLRSLRCPFCRSVIVRVTIASRQMAFCGCRFIEDRILPRPAVRRANSGKR